MVNKNDILNALAGLYDPTFDQRMNDLQVGRQQQFDTMTGGANATADKQMLMEALANMYSTTGGVLTNSLPDAQTAVSILGDRQSRLDNVSSGKISALENDFDDQTRVLEQDYRFKKADEETKYNRSRQEKMDARNKYELTILEDEDGNPYYGYFDKDNKKFVKDGKVIENAKPYYNNYNQSKVETIEVYDPQTDSLTFATRDKNGVIRDGKGQIRTDLQPKDAWETKEKALKEKNNPSTTEGQRKAATFALRMSEANKIFDAVREAGYNAENMLEGGWDRSMGEFPVVGNYMRSEGGQKYEAAKRDFINAILRKESGATIGQDEFDSAERQYFPQVGDTEAVVEQKRKLRERVTGAMREEAGPAYDIVTKGQSTTTAPKPEGLSDGAVKVGSDNEFDYYLDASTGKKYRVKK